MHLFFENFSWMLPNLVLASLAVLLGLMFLRSKQIYIKVPLFILWILFLPNTIYLVTDLQHLPAQLENRNITDQAILFFQFIVLISIGPLSYFVAMRPFEAIFKKMKIKKQNQIAVLATINAIVAIAVVMGKIERTHSWYVFTQPLRVLDDFISLVTTPYLLILTTLFAILFNLIYFSLRKRINSLK